MNILLDNGHGGIIEGVYQTAGKRSPLWDDGTQLFEGDFNRKIVAYLISSCNKHEIDVVNIVPELTDVSLNTRVKRVNSAFKSRPDSILLSIHANAGGGTGYEMFTTKGETKSDKIANTLIKEYGKIIPELKLRKDTRDGDLDKEAQFYIIRKTFCPAVLIECAFMDTKYDCDMMLNNPELFAKAIFAGILEIKKGLLS